MKLLLVRTNQSPQSVLPHMADSGSWQWMYLGRSYSRLLQWESSLPAHVSRLAIGERLQEIAWNLRRPFLELIAEWGKKYNSLDWWVSRLSERNTTISPLFLNCCYLQLVSEILDKQQGNLCIVAESLALLESVEVIARAQGYEVHWVEFRSEWKHFVSSRRLRRVVRGLRYYGRDVPRFWWSFLRWGKEHLEAAHRTRHLGRPLPSNANRPRVLLHTFIDETRFGPDGQFKERYWGRLPSWLSQHGYDVVFIPFLLNIQRSVEEALAELRQSNAQFLIPEDYYQLSDYLRAIPTGIRQFFMLQGPVFLGLLDITRLVAEEKAQQAVVSHTPRCRMYYELAHRLADANFRVDYVLHTFENHIWEKALILGFRRFLPRTKIVGFQHTAFFPFYLCNFIPQGEVDIAPLADRIVCNGPFFEEILVAEGLPPERVAVGCALRYEHLHTLSTDSVQAAGTENTILITLSLEPDAVDELIYKVLCAFKDAPELSVWIKPHPMMPLARVRAALGSEEMPPHFRVVEGSMSEWLPRTNLLISTGSTTAYESLAMGIPVLRVGREIDLDFDPLAWLPEYRQACYSPEGIRRRAIELLNLDATERQRLREFGQELLRKSFAPVTKEGLRRFVPEDCQP